MAANLGTNKHAQLSDFITAVSEKNTKALSTQFGLSHAVILGIYDLLPVYFSTGTTLSAPPLDSQHIQVNKAPLITVYDTGEGDMAIECFILENDEPSEAILHVSFFASSPNTLIYEFIDS